MVVQKIAPWKYAILPSLFSATGQRGKFTLKPFKLEEILRILKVFEGLSRPAIIYGNSKVSGIQ